MKSVNDLCINESLLSQVERIAVQAGDAIMQVYDSAEQMAVQEKADFSPVTEADLAAHHLIVRELSQINPAWPVLSEESTLPDFSERQQWQTYWLVDPLDGTKEFIQRRPEFTVNIALIEKGVPVLGVVYAPVTRKIYSGGKKLGAFRVVNQQREKMTTRAAQCPLTIVASRHHGTEALTDLLNQLEKHTGPHQLIQIGSSLKICLIAEGKADFYPRLAPTCEWDTAAAQAVLEAAGGIIVTQEGQPLRYNTKANIKNPYFFVMGQWSECWQQWGVV